MDTFDELQNSSQARDAHRRNAAITARREALDARLNVLAAEHLGRLVADRPAEVGGQLEQFGAAYDRADAVAVALRDLAGLDDNAYPWRRWIGPGDGGDPTPPYRTQLGQWEEVYVARADRAEHPDAYGDDPAEAQFQRAVAEARVLALRDLLAELAPLAEAQAAAAAAPKAKRGRSGGGDPQ